MNFEEFERRFIARMVARGATWVEASPYGKRAARAAWDDVQAAEEPDRSDRANSPEDEADTDMSYWGD